MSKLLQNCEEQLIKLEQLQKIDIELDLLQEKKGTLPITIEKLESTVADFEKEIATQEDKIETHQTFIASQQKSKKESEKLIEKYEVDLQKIKNQREYEAITKDLELEKLEVLLNQKRIKENKYQIELLEKEIAKVKEKVDDTMGMLTIKKEKLDSIVKKSEEAQQKLLKKRTKIFKDIREDLYASYQSIRTKKKSAIVNIEENACSGCFIIVPLEIQLNIKDKKNIFYCENCGRFLNNIIEPAVVEKPKRRMTSRKRASSLA